MTRVLTALMAFITFSAIPSAVNQYRMFVDACDRQQKGDLAGAAQLYASLLSSHPDGLFRHEALFNLAGAETLLGHYTQASMIYAGLEQFRGTMGANAAYNHGNLLASTALGSPKTPESREQLRAALACYRKALTTDPENTNARINYEIVQRALRNTTPPPSSSSGGGSGNGAPGNQPRQQGLNVDVSNMVLDNARQEEGAMMRRYFRPAPPRQTPREQKDW
jgi:tetratricopeptide (TPR) repeat protein